MTLSIYILNIKYGKFLMISKLLLLFNYLSFSLGALQGEGRRESTTSFFYFSCKKKKKNKFFFVGGGGNFFLGAIYLGMVVVPLSKKAKNLPRTYKKLYCKEESNRCSGQRYPTVQTDRQIQIHKTFCYFCTGINY